MERKRKYVVGEHVVYVDQWGIPRDALVTNWFIYNQTVEEYKTMYSREPGCNVILISGDPAKQDSCGRQSYHETSTVHKTNQAAPGRYWCNYDELDEDQRSMMNQEHVS